MKKGLVLSAVLLSLLALSCSKGKQPAPSFRPDGWKTDATLPVPVSIGVGAASADMSKASAIDVLSGHTFGVISLGDPNAPYPMFLRKNARVGIGGNVELLNAEGEVETFYYPFESANNYSFHAYYVGDQVRYDTVEKFGDGYGIVIPDYGKVDVLYGRSDAEDLYPYEGSAPVKGFNSNYIRTLNEMGLLDREHLPQIRLKHLTSMINFVFSYDYTEGDPSSQLYLSRVTACDVDYSGRLMFEEGGIRTFTNGRVDYFTSIWVGKEKALAPEVNFYFAPETLGSLSMDLSLNYSSAVGSQHVLISSEQIHKVLEQSGLNGFEAGHRYTFDVVISRQNQNYSASIGAYRNK